MKARRIGFVIPSLAILLALVGMIGAFAPKTIAAAAKEKDTATPAAPGAATPKTVVAQRETAAPAASGGGFKIGVVNRKKVFDSYEKRQAELDAINKKMEEYQTQMDAMSAKIEASQAALNKGIEDKTLTDEQIRDQRVAVQNATEEYRAQFKKLENEINAQADGILKKMKDEIDTVIKEIGAQDNYDIILEGDPLMSTSVIYYSTARDITPKVIEKIKAK